MGEQLSDPTHTWRDDVKNDLQQQRPSAEGTKVDKGLKDTHRHLSCSPWVVSCTQTIYPRHNQWPINLSYNKPKQALSLVLQVVATNNGYCQSRSIQQLAGRVCDYGGRSSVGSTPWHVNSTMFSALNHNGLPFSLLGCHLEVRILSRRVRRVLCNLLLLLNV